MRLLARCLVTFLLLFRIFLYPGSTFASIVINELSSDTAGTSEDPDWIELYNTGSDPVDLSAFRLRDNSATNKQDFSDVLNGNSFLWVNLQIADMLNRSRDRIRLVQKANESELVDLIVYGNEDDASVPAPSKGQSLRYYTFWV